MRTYEFTCIFRTDEDSFRKGKELVKAQFDKQSIKVLKEEDLGVKELAYEIKKETKGHYYYYELEASPETIAAMEKDYRLSNTFLKYLFVKKEK